MQVVLQCRRLFSNMLLHAAFYAPQTRSKILLRVEEAADTGHIIVERQLVVPGDNGVGRVHMVQLGANPHENHFLYDIDGDVNEGQKALVDRRPPRTVCREHRAQRSDGP